MAQENTQKKKKNAKCLVETVTRGGAVDKTIVGKSFYRAKD